MMKKARITIWSTLGLIAIGFGGGYVLREGWLEFVLYHIGGLGAVGLLACASAIIAEKKGYNYWQAWLVALLLPVFLGLIAAYLATPENQGIKPEACGGSASLGVGLILIAVWGLRGSRRGDSKQPIREE